MNQTSPYNDEKCYNKVGDTYKNMMFRGCNKLEVNTWVREMDDLVILSLATVSDGKGAIRTFLELTMHVLDSRVRQYLGGKIERVVGRSRTNQRLSKRAGADSMLHLQSISLTKSIVDLKEEVPKHVYKSNMQFYSREISSGSHGSFSSLFKLSSFKSRRRRTLAAFHKTLVPQQRMA